LSPKATTNSRVGRQMTRQLGESSDLREGLIICGSAILSNFP
jgi:hypothetical protein